MNNIWICPICGSRAYQRYGGITLPAVKIDESVSPPRHEKTSYKMGRHFMCKGCSVFFSNPNLFNLITIKEKSKDAEEMSALKSLKQINEVFLDIFDGAEEIENMRKELKKELESVKAT